MKTEVAWWLEAGERDLLMARELRRSLFYEGTAFHCQQAAEKLLKGLLMHRGALWQRTHACTDLLATLGLLDLPIPAEVDTAGRRLDMHYVGARYPNGVGGPPRAFFDETIAGQALADCEAVKRFVEDHLGA